MQQELLQAFSNAFSLVPNASFEYPYFEEVPHKQLPGVLTYLLRRKVREIGLEQPARAEAFALLFSFESVWHMDEWESSLPGWVEGESYLRRSYPAQVVKINNLRWLFDREQLRTFLTLFPNLQSLQFVGSEEGPDDDVRAFHLRGGRYQGPAKLTTTQVTDLLKHAGVQSDPFSL